MNILIVDDSEEDRELLRRLFLKNGFASEQIFEADSGRVAKNLYDLHHPTLVIVDYNLPDIEGDLLIKEIRKSKNPLGSPYILALSGSDDSRIYEKARTNGADRGHVKDPQLTGNILDLLDQFNIDGMNGSLDGDESINKLWPSFVENRKNDISVLQQACSQSDFEILKKQAHQMAGICGSFQQIELHHLAKKLESASNEQNLPLCKSLCDQIALHIAQLPQNPRDI